jgi:hypothetical protein
MTSGQSARFAVVRSPLLVDAPGDSLRGHGMTSSHYRLEFIAHLEEQIGRIGSCRDGRRFPSAPFGIDASGTLHFQLLFRLKTLMLNSGETALTAETLDDLIAQLEQLKEITTIGGLDSILDAAMNSSE